MTIKVGINGMGRIGRMIVRSIYENYKGKIVIKHINNRSSSEICANLLKYDSIHGNFSSLVKSGENYIKINKSLNVLKANIEEAKNKFSSGSLDFEDVYKSIIN